MTELVRPTELDVDAFGKGGYAERLDILMQLADDARVDGPTTQTRIHQLNKEFQIRRNPRDYTDPTSTPRVAGTLLGDEANALVYTKRQEWVSLLARGGVFITQSMMATEIIEPGDVLEIGLDAAGRDVDSQLNPNEKPLWPQLARRIGMVSLNRSGVVAMLYDRVNRSSVEPITPLWPLERYTLPTLAHRDPTGNLSLENVQRLCLGDPLTRRLGRAPCAFASVRDAAHRLTRETTIAYMIVNNQLVLGRYVEA